MVKKTLTVAILLFISSAVRADGTNQPPEPVPKPSIVFTDGQPVVAVFESGNEATLRVMRNPAIGIKADFQVTETSCSPDAGQAFQMTLGLAVDETAMVWTKHKDPKRVGKNVKLFGSSDSSNDYILTNTLANSTPESTKGLPADSFAFGDVKWIPGLEDGVKRSFTIDSWLVETMVTNPQTGVDENRITASFSGVHVVAGAGGDMHITGIDSGQKIGFGGIFALLGDVVTWVVTAPDGHSCQITTKPDTGGVTTQITKYANSLSHAYIDYKWNEDFLTKMMGGEKYFIFDDLEYADDK